MSEDDKILQSKKTNSNTFEYDQEATSNYIVKYDNLLGDIPLTGFTKRQLDLLFTLLVKLKGKNDNTVSLNFTEIKKISEYTQSNDKTFIKDLIETNAKIQKLHVGFWEDETYTSFVLFPTFKIDTKDRTLELKVNKEYTFLINNLEGTFTRFRLKQFLSLKKTYSKILFKKLMQFKHSGRYYVRIDDFKQLMDIPKSYKTKEISKKIILPAIEEISNNNYLKNLTFDKEYKGKGRKLSKLTFSFDPIPTGLDTYETIDEKDSTDEYGIFKPFSNNTNKKGNGRVETINREWEEDFIDCPNIVNAYKAMIESYTSQNYLEVMVNGESDLVAIMNKCDVDVFINEQIKEIKLYNKVLSGKEKKFGKRKVGIKGTYVESKKTAKIAKYLPEEIREEDYQELNSLWETTQKKLNSFKSSV